MLRSALKAHAHRPVVADDEQTPGTIFSGVYDWWRADFGVTLNGSDVSSWAGQGGTGNDLAQAAAGKQPLFSAGTGPGGNDEIQFTAANSDILRDTAAAAGLTGYRLYVFIVANFTSTAANTSMFETDGTTGDYTSLRVLASGPKLRALMILSDGTSSITKNPFSNGTDDHYFEYHNASTNAELVIDGTANAGTKSGTVADTLDTIAAGASRSDTLHADCNISEITMVGPTAPSAGEISTWRTYVGTRYGL